ncbi:amidohydrolase [Paenibacillus sp. HN-1]|uniref:amidohydrolase n=1 Tax=Paenibacillus TaxID=44249 RepID=UPI001CA93570|nr:MULTISPECIES: amidohydrolase [Paenibacillus]MBY9078124.1 amidohydrolase [Paenibacillus sp. CGMCC 1.18879]MBY9083865.1 amidohydrolase [Paenibacillus sinensis]
MAIERHDLNYSKQVVEIVEQKEELLTRVSDQIWSFAETRYEEYKSAELLASVLEEEGFTVERNAGGIETAFVASYGEGKPVIAILGEYDALSDLSQEKGKPEYIPQMPGGNGHGCGHNLLGTGALGAALAVRTFMEQHHIQGTVRYYGCPAEEGGGGKAYMVRKGLFSDVDTAVTWHPGGLTNIMDVSSLATSQVFFRFKGKSAHAGGDAYLGRSALDAVELTNVGCNYLREHIIPEARIHYAITRTGGVSPNVVQSDAEVLYKIRTPKSEQLAELYERVCNVAKGAALMTGTELSIQYDSGSSELIVNRVLEQFLFDKLNELGIPEFSELEKGFAAEIRSTMSEAELRHIPEELNDEVFTNRIESYKPTEEVKVAMGSTDVGDVSWNVPTAQAWIASMALGTSLHSWQAVSQFGTSIGHKGMLHASKLLGAAVVGLFEHPEIIEQAKQEWSGRMKNRRYECPIPEGFVPQPIIKG